MTLLTTLAGRTAVYQLADGVAIAAAPSTAAHGIALPNVGFDYDDSGWVIIAAASGSGLSVASARVVGRDDTVGEWGPLGTGTATTRGLLNGGAAIPQVTGYPVLLCELVNGLRAFDRIAVELGAVTGGTVDVYLKLAKRRR